MFHSGQYRSQNNQEASNESLAQVLREIRQELQQLRQQIRRLDGRDMGRHQQYSTQTDTGNWSQRSRYDNDRDDNRYNRSSDR